MVAAVTIPEMALQDDEAKALAEALAEVEKHYPVNPLSDKHMAVLGLVVCCGRIYGPRAALLLMPKPPAPKSADAGKTAGAGHAPVPSVAPVVPPELAETMWTGLPQQ